MIYQQTIYNNCMLFFFLWRTQIFPLNSIKLIINISVIKSKYPFSDMAQMTYFQVEKWKSSLIYRLSLRSHGLGRFSHLQRLWSPPPPNINIIIYWLIPLLPPPPQISKTFRRPCFIAVWYDMSWSLKHISKSFTKFKQRKVVIKVCKLALTISIS